MESEIIDDLLLDIKENKYSYDEKLPSENYLSEKYSVPRIQVRNAYKRLEQMGYIYPLQGRGRFLNKQTKSIELLLSGHESFTSNMKANGYNLETINVFCERIPYHEGIFSELGVSREVPVYKIGRLRIVDHEPLAIHISYISKNVFEDISAEGKSITSMFDYYNNKGFIDYKSNKAVIEICYPTSRERSYLNCIELVPVLKLSTNCIDKKSDTILEYTEIIYRGDKFKYKI